MCRFCPLVRSWCLGQDMEANNSGTIWLGKKYDCLQWCLTVTLAPCFICLFALHSMSAVEPEPASAVEPIG